MESLSAMPLWRVKGGAGRDRKARTSRSFCSAGGDEKRVTLSIPRARFEAPAPVRALGASDVAVVTVPAFDARDGGRACARRDRGAPTAAGSSAWSSTCAARSAERESWSPRAASLRGQGHRGESRRAQGRACSPLESTGERLWKGKTVVLTDDRRAGAAEVSRRFPRPTRRRDDRGREPSGWRSFSDRCRRSRVAASS